MEQPDFDLINLLDAYRNAYRAHSDRVIESEDAKRDAPILTPRNGAFSPQDIFIWKEYEGRLDKADAAVRTAAHILDRARQNVCDYIPEVFRNKPIRITVNGTATQLTVSSDGRVNLQ